VNGRYGRRVSGRPEALLDAATHRNESRRLLPLRGGRRRFTPAPPTGNPLPQKITTAGICPWSRLWLGVMGSPFSATVWVIRVKKVKVPELVPVLGSQPAGDVSHKAAGRLPLLSRRQVEISVGRPPDTSWKRPPGRPRTKWTDQLHRDNNNVPAATLRRQAIGRGHSRATLRSEPTTR